MGLDDNAKAWQRMVKQLQPRLPGEWRIGRSGIGTILVRQPVEWVVTWVGAARSRRSQNPRIWVAQMPLVSERLGGLALGHGVTSDRPTGPGLVDLTVSGAAGVVEGFVREVGLPHVTWAAHDFAAAAERQFAQPDEERGRPLHYPEASGWRVVLGTGSPVEPALEAAAWFEDNGGSDAGAWYRALAEAWTSGGREAALALLTANRDAAVAALKLR